MKKYKPNIGQYIYSNQPGTLTKLFPDKTMKEIRKMIKFRYPKTRR